MRAVALALVFILPISAALLAGCTCPPTGPPVSARGIGSGTPTSSGAIGYGFTVKVLAEPGGPPLPDAGVVFYWANDNPSQWQGQDENGRVVVSPGNVEVTVPGQAATPSAASTLRLRTGPDGTALGKVPANRVIGVVAAADGWTEEWVPAVASGSLGEGDTLTIPLYRSTLEATTEGTWGPGGLSSGRATQNNYLWKPEILPFGESEETRKGYSARVARLHVRLSWETGVQGAGDLAIGLGSTEEQPAFVHDERNNVGPGRQAEEFDLNAGALKSEALLGSKELYVGPATQSGYVAPLGGLPYTMELEGEFDPAIAAEGECGVNEQSESTLPGFSVPWPVVATLAGLSLAALARPRRF